MSSGYGFFCGGDPRRFYPDPECSTEAERAKHKADCEAWDRGEMPNVNHNAPHFVGDSMMHVIPGGYGLGGYDYDDDDDIPDDQQPHDYDPACECFACYEEGVMQRFRASQSHARLVRGEVK